MGDQAYKQALSRHIKWHRHQHHMNQAELAYEADVSEKYISRLENAKHIPSFRTMNRLAHALDIAMDQLGPQIEADLHNQSPDDD